MEVFGPVTRRLSARAFNWLISLRWFAFGSQIIALVASSLFLQIHWWLPGLVGACALTGVSNALLSLQRFRRLLEREWVVMAVIVGDVLLLGLMLYWSGGILNPFTALFLLHISVGTTLLSRGPAVTVALSAGLAMVVLYGASAAGGLPSHHDSGISMDLHYQGMVAALLLTGFFIVFFIGRLRRLLAQQEEELENHRIFMEQQERFAGLANLAAGVAHELATPLATIAVASQELEQSLRQQSGEMEGAEDASLIRGEVARCRSIIDRLSPYSDGDTGGESRAVSVEEVIHRLKTSLTESIVKRLDIDRQTEASVWISPLVLQQTLGALAKNAVEADPGHHPIQFCIRSRDGKVEFSFSDRGPGFPSSIQAHWGEPFSTTKSPGFGMGLGLYLARIVAKQREGELTIENLQEGGSCVTLKLPECPSND